jgi:hypothetical protein
MTADSRPPPDPAVLALARAMARLAAREDHEAEQQMIATGKRGAPTEAVNADNRR